MMMILILPIMMIIGTSKDDNEIYRQELNKEREKITKKNKNLSSNLHDPLNDGGNNDKKSNNYSQEKFMKYSKSG